VTCRTQWLVLALLGCGASPSLAFESRYTTHDYEQCPLVREYQDAQERRCEGLGSIGVNYHNASDASLVDFGAKGSTGDWPGQSFVFPAETIEWRGATKAGVLIPFAAIVRYDMGQSIGGPFRPSLVVYRLEDDSRSCVAATVDGRRAGAEAAARKLADTFARTFRCGRDHRRAM